MQELAERGVTAITQVVQPQLEPSQERWGTQMDVTRHSFCATISFRRCAGSCVYRHCCGGSAVINRIQAHSLFSTRALLL